MKQAIYKYQIGFLEDQTIRLPESSEIVRVDVVEGRVYIWALVSVEESMEEDRRIIGLKTGAVVDLNGTLTYIGCAAIEIQMELMLYFYEVSDVR